MITGRQVLVDSFQRLFAKAAAKLQVAYAPEDMALAQRQFEERFASVLEAVDALHMERLPTESTAALEKAIEELAPTDIVGQLATVPLAHQAQEMLRVLAHRDAEQRLLEHALQQVEERYGGN